jgi:cell division protease FtsH
MGQSFGLLSAGEDGSRQSGFSQRTAFAAESEAREIVDTAINLARTVLIEHREDLETLAQRLLDVETVEGDQLVEMFGPAATAAPQQKRAPVPVYPSSVRLVRPAQPTGKHSRAGRFKALPGVVAAFTRSSKFKHPMREPIK